jgi:hypothetical protein
VDMSRLAGVVTGALGPGELVQLELGLDACPKRGFTDLYIGSSPLVRQGVKLGDLGN